VYALVSRGKTVLAEYTASSGNFPTVTRVLLAKIPTEDSKMSYVYDQYTLLEKVLDRGEKFELLVDRTDKLSQQSFVFNRKAKKLRKTLWWRSVKMWACLGVVGLSGHKLTNSLRDI
ncbi:hypothetical protein DYB32_007474, partial [Aphanomyces invadans]